MSSQVTDGVFELSSLGGKSAFVQFGGLHLPPPGLRLSLRRWGALLALAGLALPGVRAAEAGTGSRSVGDQPASRTSGGQVVAAAARPAATADEALPLGDPWEAVVTEPAPPGTEPPRPTETARGIPTPAPKAAAPAPPAASAPAPAPTAPEDAATVVPDLVPASRRHIGLVLARSAKENGLPVDLIMALAWKESSWRPGAVSRAGAVGVMQLMPATVTFVSRNLFDLPANLDPHNATANIRMGTRFLAHLVSVYDGSYRRALIAYNQGITSLRTRGPHPGAERFADTVLGLRSKFRAA